jgi:hypothetical protein
MCGATGPLQCPHFRTHMSDGAMLELLERSACHLNHPFYATSVIEPFPCDRWLTRGLSGILSAIFRMPFYGPSLMACLLRPLGPTKPMIPTNLWWLWCVGCNVEDKGKREHTWTSNMAVGSITSPVSCCRNAAAFFLDSSFTAAHSARNSGSSAASLSPLSCGRSLQHPPSHVRPLY